MIHSGSRTEVQVILARKPIISDFEYFMNLTPEIPNGQQALFNWVSYKSRNEEKNK